MLQSQKQIIWGYLLLSCHSLATSVSHLTYLGLLHETVCPS